MESIRPTGGKAFAEQVDSCISQLSDFIEPNKEPGYFIAQQTFFIAASNRLEYDEKAAIIREKLAVIPGTRFPATSVVAVATTSSMVILKKP